MKPRTVVLAGASGFIGRYFRERFVEEGWQVRTVGRGASADAQWNDDGAITTALDGAELLVNLAGRSVNCRYNVRNRREIMDSRVLTTRELGRAVSACEDPPRTWINSSTGTIYRHAEDRPQSEDSGELGSGFSVDVARAWEDELDAAVVPATRKVPLRIAIVLGPGGGVMGPFRNLARLGLGGYMGPGTQKFSWIHVEDLFRVVLFAHAHGELTGPLNAASPYPVDNRELMSLVRQSMRVPFGIPTPSWLLEAGAVLIRTQTELVLKSRWVEPRKLLDAGFAFEYPCLTGALNHIANPTRSLT
ncbi:TIGR01777 family oxidoreductase [Paenarthrobacter aurescens]|uniref:NAD-dependent epimerase n=1 Tax=Paenarthrobacter aurescens TaxID=43663 RepID=A0A4Y3NCR4_PAEAU|nr:TIGR01777 family oxidoreductase [Paenarthrobacter aurescens]MDO6142344.1 TIGR01777 family oxidoreductase [Paenarthrobacter aurescens]MDO6146191.1 TIGR01777 family oxidoreductase [Paenarthrobacter aurescens]MDO6157436.1 TIGR01777 family oxidoreductase [Paenarthrobacter aurescens]MDO6161421.1 TIGR01777 family oxidoreductase [Paenarthrobacter aurescens]GEB18937.1 NAD-dependent epimerase [Paenarthrobacter aurescens]